ncbi:type II secretion system protein GspM [Xanthomonas maliensis]|uniref:type II secretion system protein GspM n=1 Tax=Xanthomonas maliensis TaxID=1321368 RepID=UPI0003A9E6E5|nr:type II secretion system protein GspM [Xanthomonas maliensis]KAB7765498.1 general secretion pathway protein GspM [Xanthomonas maliensis]
MPSSVKRDRWAALGLLLLAIGVGYLVLVHPWFTQPLLAIQDELTSLRERELRVRVQLQQAPEISQRLRQARATLEQRPGFLPETSAELASAGLVQRLERAVSDASPGNRSCAISNRSPLQPETKDRFTRVAVQVRLRCGTPELASVLYHLEKGAPRLFVDNLNVMAQRYQLSPNESGNGLDIAFELAGYLRPGSNDAAPAAATVKEAPNAP